jgi:Na+-driven multidrug efflux pump
VATTADASSPATANARVAARGHIREIKLLSLPAGTNPASANVRVTFVEIIFLSYGQAELAAIAVPFGIAARLSLVIDGKQGSELEGRLFFRV